MKISKSVAYRYYVLAKDSKSIAFNLKTRKYMFLDGLAAELLELILKEEDLHIFMDKNDLTVEDIKWFKEQLFNFGLFESCLNETHITANVIDNETNDEEHREELNEFMRELRSNKLYYAFHIDLTNRCNEKCVHCYHPFEQYDYTKEMTTNDIKNLIDMVYELGVFSITLSGGECLLRKDFFEILKYISEKNLLTTIYTNGMLINDDFAKKIKDYRVEIVSISLYGDSAEIHDGVTRIKGSFDKTIAGINVLKKYNIPFELKCVLLANNIHRINEIKVLSQKLNYGKVCKIEFALSGKINGDCGVFDYGAPEKEIAKVFIACPEYSTSNAKLKSISLESSPCGAGKYGLYCSAEGGIYPCVAFRLYLCNYTELPKIFDNSILNDWLSAKVSDFTDCLKYEYCKYCFRLCAGDNLVENGNCFNSHEVSSCRLAKEVLQLMKNGN